MEKKKKRKASDKERKRAALENGGGKSTRPNNSVVVESNSEEPETSLAAASSITRALTELPLHYFTDLASPEASVREEAASSLVSILQENQKQYEMLPDKESINGGLVLEAEKNDGLDNCAPQLRYALRRLVRGVSSSRECARQGFALGLTLVVSLIPSISVESLLKLISEFLSVSSSMKGQDVKECLLGRLFVYGALARSGRLIEVYKSDKDSQVIKEFTDVVISLAAKKRYLQEPAVHVLLDFVEKLPVEAVMTHVMEAPELQKWFEQATEVGNPDALLLVLKLREMISVDHPVFGKLLPVPFSSAKFFSADHLSAIGNCLKESTFCQPRVHSLWPVIRDMLLPETVQSEDVTSTPSSSKKQKRSRKSNPIEEEATNNIRNFCEVFMDGNLLSSSHDRKHLALDILLLLLPKLPASFFQHVLSYKIVQCLMDILSTKDSWLHKVATHFLVELMEWVKDDTKRVAVIMALQKHSGGKFDNITRTKTVKDLTADFETEDGCTLFLQNLMNLFVDEQHAPEEPSSMKWAVEPCSLNSDQSQTTDDNSEIGSNEEKDSVGTAGNSDALKSWIIESLPGILKHAKLAPEAKLRVQKQILKFLAVQGLFLASLGTEVTSFELQEKFKWPKSATPTALCKMCIEQLQLLLSNSQKIEKQLSKENGLEQPDDLVSYFMKFFGTLQNIPSVSFFRPLNEADDKAVKVLQESESKLSKEESNCGLSVDALKYRALRHLVVQLLLQTLLHPGEFFEAASELSVCCDKAFKSSLDLPKSDGEGEAGGDDEEPAVMDVLVDTLLSLLPHSSAPMRSSIEQVFKHFCEDITNDGLLRMLRVIKKDLKPARHQAVRDSEDLEDDDDDCLAIEEEEDEENEEMGETGESDEQTDDSETVTGVVQMEVDKEVPENSDDSDSDDDDGMDDDAMFRMDTYLAQIFKEKRNQAGGESAQAQLVLFKLRVLSLLEIYLHENSGKPQVMTVYLNLAQALVNPSTAESSQQLLQRIWGVIQKKIFKASKVPRDESFDLPALVSLLEKNLKMVAKPFNSKKSGVDPSKKKQSSVWNRHKLITNLGQNSTHWVLRIIDSKNFSKAELEKISDVFRSVLVRFFETKRSQMKMDFVEEVFRKKPVIAHQLFGFLVEKSGESKFEFRRVQSLEMITETLRSLVPVNEKAQEESKKIMNCHMKKLVHLIKQVVRKMSEKSPWQKAQVRKFCARVFHTVSALKLTKSLLKGLGPNGQAACETGLGDLFLNLKKTED
ncbi:unnamed protein product [Cochlearia groenlandica]